MIQQQVTLVLEVLCGVTLAAFHGMLWGLTLRALVDCGDNAACVYSLFDSVIAEAVLDLARDGPLSEAALDWTVPTMLRSLYHMIMFGAVFSFGLSVIILLATIWRVEIMLNLWINLQLLWLPIVTWIYYFVSIKLCPMFASKVVAVIQVFGFCVLFSSFTFWLKIR